MRDTPYKEKKGEVSNRRENTERSSYLSATTISSSVGEVL